MFVVPIVKCVGVMCNLKCQYCFYRNLDQKFNPGFVMDEWLLEKLIRDMFDLEMRKYCFIWHGGEPLLAGIKFFQRVVDYQLRYKPKGSVVENHIQTNGTLLNDKWLQFFNENRFVVGVSIDGPEFVHDTYRRTENGESTCKMIIENIRKAQAMGIPIGVIACITAYSARYPEEIYRFFVNSGIKNITFNPVFEIENGHICEFSVSDNDYTRFLLKIIDLWADDDDPEVYIRQIHQPLEGLLGGRPTFCIFSGRCADFVNIHPNGDVTPCNEKRREWILGNLRAHTLKQIIEGNEFQKFKASIQTPPGCRKCKWLSLCYGGCPYHQMNVNGVIRYQYCGSRRAVFARLEQIITEYKKSRKEV